MGVYEIFDEETIDGAKVEYGFDSGLGTGASNFVNVETDDHRISRVFYFDGWHKNHARNFARKFITDADYRQACLDGTADWKQVNDIYTEFDRRLMDIFSEAGLTGYRRSNDLEEQRYKTASGVREQLCEQAYNYIKSQINNDKPVQDRLDSLAEEAQEIATKLSLTTGPNFEIGDLALDQDQEDPDTAIVVALPNTSIDEHYVDNDTTVADYNPEYPENVPVVEVAFLPSFTPHLPAGTTIDTVTPEQVQEIATSPDITTYSYPLPRLTRPENA